ncbi:MAG TPA: DUF6644 family protein [Vicinamibacterales bacterium]|jgi:hypothetical protein
MTAARRRRLWLIGVWCAAAAATGCAGRVNDGMWQRFAGWAAASAIGAGISGSSWLFAAIESLHLAGLAVLGGAVILVDLSLLGLALGDEPLPRLSRDAEPWLLAGLIVTVASGTLLFLSEATKFYSAGFWDSAEAPFVAKMVFLAAAVVFTFTVRRRILRASDRLAGPPSLRDRLVAMTSLLLWLGVGVGGRAIGFY